MDLLNDDFGQRLKAIRESRQLTQIDLAKKTNLSNQVISNLERNYTKTISYNDLKALAQALDCEIGDLIPDSNKFSDDLLQEIDIGNQIKYIYDLLNSNVNLKLNNRFIDAETKDILKVSLDGVLKIIEIKSTRNH